MAAKKSVNIKSIACRELYGTLLKEPMSRTAYLTSIQCDQSVYISTAIILLQFLFILAESKYQNPTAYLK